jgi:hypothetical protein
MGRNGFDSRWRTLELTIEAEPVLIAYVSTRRSARVLATHFWCSLGGLAGLSGCRLRKLADV